MMTQKDIDKIRKDSEDLGVFRGIAFAWFFTACIILIGYLVARWL